MFPGRGAGELSTVKESPSEVTGISVWVGHRRARRQQSGSRQQQFGSRQQQFGSIRQQFGSWGTPHRVPSQHRYCWRSLLLRLAYCWRGCTAGMVLLCPVWVGTYNPRMSSHTMGCDVRPPGLPHAHGLYRCGLCVDCTAESGVQSTALQLQGQLSSQLQGQTLVASTCAARLWPDGSTPTVAAGRGALLQEAWQDTRTQT